MRGTSEGSAEDNCVRETWNFKLRNVSFHNEPRCHTLLKEDMHHHDWEYRDLVIFCVMNVQ